MPSFALQRQVHLVRVDVSRQPDMAVDRLREKQLEIALRQPLEESRDLGRRQIVRSLPQELVETRLIALDQLVAVPLREMVVGIHVEAPEQLLFPRRQRFRTDRPDIGERHQAEHLQALLGADEGREVLDDLRILGVAAEGDQRHAQVVLDQEEHRLAPLADELQTIDDVLGHPLALERVIVVPPFADVVEQQRQYQQFWLVEGGDHVPEALPIGLLGVRDPLEVANRQQRVLVDRVLVIEVPDHAPRDGLEFREHTTEEATVVHFREPRVEPVSRLQQGDKRRAVARLREEVVGAIAIDVLLDAGERFLGDLSVGIDRRVKRAQPRCGIAGRLNRIEEADAVAREPQVRADRHRGCLPGPPQRPADDAGMAEVVAHQALDPLAGFGARVAEQIRRPLLHVVAQHVLIASGVEMQGRSHAQQEVLGLIEARRIRRTAAKQQRVGQHRDRARRREISQRPRRFLHVGLELIQRVVEGRMTLIDQLEERLEDVGVGRGGVKQHAETVEERARAGDRTRIEERQEKLRIVGLQPAEVVQLTDLMADDDTQIPERVEEATEELLLIGTDAAAKEHEQVDVGLQTQMASAVPAERQHRDLRVRPRHVGEQLAEHGIHTIGIALERGATAGTPQRVRLELGSSGIERRHECGSAGARLGE